MKITGLLLFISVASLFAAGTYAQTTKLNLQVSDEQIAEVLLQIEKQSEFHFFYNEEVDVKRKVSIRVKDKTVFEVLDQILEGTGTDYKVIGQQIALFNQDNPFNWLSVQQAAVSGTVTDEDGQPLPGVTVVVKGTTQGTVTNADGKYSITDLPEDATLVFSFVGMRTEELEVGDQTTINVTMAVEAVGMEEVVVIGYGTQEKSNLTAAVKMVDTKDLENRPVKSVTEMLTASVPNLNVLVGSSAPDAEPGINIRGFTGFNSRGAPLILVDGVPQDIKFVNPEDVRSISVLKDAAASAIYGSRAPNGVILITTKSGKKGQQMQIKLNSDFQFSEPLGLPNSVNGYDYAVYGRNMRRYNSRQPALISDETIERMRQYVDGEITTKNIILPNGKYGGVWDYNASEDRYANAFREIVPSQRYNLSITGGDEKTTYYGSIGLLNREGIYDSEYDWLKRYSSVVKVHTDITEWLSVGMNAKYNRQETLRPTISNAGQNDRTLFSMLAFNPHLPDYDDNGSPNEFSILPNLDGLSGNYNNIADDLWSIYEMEIKPFKDLTIKADYSWNVHKEFDKNVELVFEGWDADGTPKSSRRSPQQDKVYERGTTINYHSANVNITYDKMLGNHDFLLLAGYNEELNKFNNLIGTNTDLYTQSIPSLSTTYGDSPILSDNISAWSTRGYFFRASYNFKGIYLLDFNSRYDASSKYSPETRWAFFPSVSAGYNIGREKFWPLKEYVGTFKIKGSWGNLGNNTGSNYSYLPTMGTSSQTPVILDGGRLPYVTMPGIISDDLTWIKPRVIGFGLETGAFNNRLNVEYDWYQRTVFDQQGPAEQYSEVLGTNPPRRNNAISETRGWELSLMWRDKALSLAGSPVNYNVRAGVSDYIGYVVEYTSNETGQRSGWTPGEVFGELYGYTSSGIAQSAEFLQNHPHWRGGWIYPGDLMFADTNGDGLVNQGEGEYWYAQGDRKLLGHTYPRYSYHVALNANWKGLGLSVLFDGVGKQVRYFANEFNFGEQVFITREELERGYWNLNNPDAFYPRAYHRRANQLFENQVNDQYAMNLAHLRIKNLNLNYDIPVALVNKINLRSLAVYLSVENAGMVFYNSWFKEMDPIQVVNGGTTYPPSRTYSIGLKLGI